MNNNVAGYEVCDTALASVGEAMLEETRAKMPILNLIELRLAKSQVFAGLKIALCLHATSETAAFALAIKAGGADVYFTGSNPRTINDDVMAALAKSHGIHVYADSTKDDAYLQQYWDRVAQARPDIIADDGAVFLGWIRGRSDGADVLAHLIGSSEQTTSGVDALQELERNGKLAFPVISVNDSNSKYLYDNQFGVAQSFVLTCNKIDPFLFSGKTFVICGFGWCGRGAARMVSGMGANVIVTEIDPFKAMEAYMLGYRVMPIRDAVKYGDVFATFTGSTKVIDYDAMCNMRSGALVMNCGSGQTEIDVEALMQNAIAAQDVNEYITAYTLPNGTQIRLVTEGRVANIACTGGNAAEVMDLSFSIHATALEYLVQNRNHLKKGLQCVPNEVDQTISKLKLLSYGVSIDVPTQEQKDYAARYVKGTL